MPSCSCCPAARFVPFSRCPFTPLISTHKIKQEPSAPTRARRAGGKVQANSKYAGQSPEQIQALVTGAAKALLDDDTEQDIDLQAPLMEMGFDSLATTQLVRTLCQLWLNTS